MTDTFDKNQQVRCTGTFKRIISGSLTEYDPTTVTFKFKSPSGTETTYTHGVNSELVKDSTGIYHVDVLGNESKRWHFRFEGNGPSGIRAAAEDTFEILRSVFA